MQATLLAVFIKFRDFLVTSGPWVILALLAAASLVELARAHGARRVTTDTGKYLIAGLAAAAPSLFGTFQFDYRLGLLRIALTALVLTSGVRLLDSHGRGRAAAGWIGTWDGTEMPGAGWVGQMRGLWRSVGDRFDAMALWFAGACLIAALLAIFLPFDVGFDLFGRTAWVGALLGALVGRALRPGTGMDLPLASVIMLKGGGSEAAIALLLASTPLPVRLRGGGAAGVMGAVASVVAAAAIGGGIGPLLL